MKLARIFLAVVVLLMVTAVALGDQRRPVSSQDRLKYSVSAKAGAVNLVDGDAIYKRDKADWDLLIAGDELSDGDTVRTGADSRIEILLNPGSYLRLSGDAEFLFADTSLDNLEINLIKGSAIIEAANLGGEMTVSTPNAKFTIIRTGLYRFNVDGSGASEVMVAKGRALAGSVEVKEGKKATVNGGAPVIASFDKKAMDEFDAWSKDRAKILIAANKSLSEKVMRRNASLAFAGSRWYYNPFTGCWTFLPVGWGFSSPYGWAYARCNPYWYNYPAYYGGYSGGRSAVGSGGQTGSGRGSWGGGVANGGGRRPDGGRSRGGESPGRGSNIDRPVRSFPMPSTAPPVGHGGGRSRPPKN
ncbi:MAG TPA: FecR family protein [Blastocatellia bacterium]|nr:FecR family protein [Blastocatellia bacterium]